MDWKTIVFVSVFILGVLLAEPIFDWLATVWRRIMGDK
jgi:hypothetical protein